MRTLVALGMLLALTASAAAAPPGEGRFRSEGVIDLQGVEGATFPAPTVVVFTEDLEGLAFEFSAAFLSIERDWTDTVYVEGAGPLGGIARDVESHHDDVVVLDATGGIEAVTVGPQPSAFLAYGPGHGASLVLPETASLDASGADTADPYGRVASVGERAWWRPDVDVPVHLVTVAENGVLTLTGDFDVYLFQVDYTVNGETFRTGFVPTGPGRATVERDILHFREATLTLRAPVTSILATAVEADLAGTLRLDDASGYYEEDGTRWEASDLPALLQGTFRLQAEAVDDATTTLALSGDLVHASLAPIADETTFTPATAGKAAAATGGVAVLVVGSVFLARRGRERWAAGHVDTPTACVERALAASAEGREAEALRWYRRARALAPQDALLALDEGHAADAVGDAAAARRAYEDALKLDPDLAEGHLRYARTLALQGMQPAALSHLGRALALEPGLASEVPGDAAFAAWRDHPRFADLLRNYRGGRA